LAAGSEAEADLHEPCLNAEFRTGSIRTTQTGQCIQKRSTNCLRGKTMVRTKTRSVARAAVLAIGLGGTTLATAPATASNLAPGFGLGNGRMWPDVAGDR
jgi:hypothetical protein